MTLLAILTILLGVGTIGCFVWNTIRVIKRKSAVLSLAGFGVCIVGFMVISLAFGGISDITSAVRDKARTDADTEYQSSAPNNDSDSAASGVNTEDDSMKELEAVGDINVNKNLFNVTLTIPSDFVGEVTQSELDQRAAENGYKSATLNNDGSVTYVMTKAQHKELLAAISQSIDDALQGMVLSEEYPNFTKIEANSDYTRFKVTTKSAEVGFSDAISVMGFYMYGGMYAVFNGETVDNIHIDFVNADTGEVIQSANSQNAG